MFSAINILISTVYSSEEIDRVKVALHRNMETKLSDWITDITVLCNKNL